MTTILSLRCRKQKRQNPPREALASRIGDFRVALRVKLVLDATRLDGIAFDTAVREFRSKYVNSTHGCFRRRLARSSRISVVLKA
jgi:hypothetical protein